MRILRPAALLACVAAGQVACSLNDSAGFAAQGVSTTTPGVLPPQSHPHGASYGEWGARWWQWVLAIPTDENPLLDETGANCQVAQTGSVWFLAGTLPGGGSAERTCIVPTGKALFFPVANSFCSAEGTFEEMLACAMDRMDAATDLHAEIDGVPVRDLEAYRAASPESFVITLPEDNILGAPAGDYAPSASDGVHLMLAPLPPGEHTLRFGATFPAGVIDVEYHIVVQPGNAPRRRGRAHADNFL